MRLGEGWFTCEGWGVWIGPGDARLAFVFSDQSCSELEVYLRLKGAPGRHSSLEVGTNFSSRALAVSLAPDEIKWFRLAFPVSTQNVKVKELLFHAHCGVNRLRPGSCPGRVPDPRAASTASLSHHVRFQAAIFRLQTGG
jgi:hypothetical protein